MRPSKTTLAGASAAAFYAAAQVPGMPQAVELGLKAIAAASIAALGYHATDCPPGCPGTDRRGRPRLWPLVVAALVVALALLASLALALAGCTSPNPAAGPAHPDQPAYIVNPQVAATSNAVARLASDLAPVIPGGEALPLAAAGLFAIVGAISALVARQKSNQANALGRAIARAGASTAQLVIDSADPSDDAGKMREELNYHLAANQTEQLPQAPAKPDPQAKLPL